MSNNENTLLLEALRDWCEERGIGVGDIMQDERGAYFLDIDDFSPEQVDERKIYLPDALQEIAMI